MGLPGSAFICVLNSGSLRVSCWFWVGSFGFNKGCSCSW